MNDQLKLLIELQTDIRYIKEKIELVITEHKELETEVSKIKVTLVDHIAKVKGFGVLLGVIGSVWTVLRMLQI